MSRKYPKCEECEIKDVEHHGAFCSTRCSEKYNERRAEEEREYQKQYDLEWLIENRADLEEMLEWFKIERSNGRIR